MSLTETLRPTIDERLVTAVNTSTLAPTRATPEDGGAIGPAELLVAAGWTSRTEGYKLGRALMALESEWDGAERPRMPLPAEIAALASTLVAKPAAGVTLTDVDKKRGWVKAKEEAEDWFENERTRLISRLHTLPAAALLLSAWIAGKGIDRPEGRATAMLAWWMDHRCIKCLGAKLDRLPTGGRGAVRTCKACSGSGERELPNEQYGRVIEAHLIDCRQRALQKIRHFTSRWHKS